MFQFKRKDYEKIGISFQNQKEAECFEEIVMSDLHTRIGTDISKHLTRTQLDIFNSLTDLEEAEKSLDKHCPDYCQIVDKVHKTLKQELLENREKIPGAVQNQVMYELSRDIELLELDPISVDALCELEIDTVGELVFLEEEDKEELKTMLNRDHLHEVGNARRIAKKRIEKDSSPATILDLNKMKGVFEI